MKKILVLFLSIFAISIFADTNYLNIVDAKLSPYIGAENILSLNEGIKIGEKRYFPIAREKRWLPVMERALEMAFVWNPLCYAEMVLQHEFFGHGYRIRDLGFKYAFVSSYKISAPPPYGHGGGVTSYKVSDSYTAFQDMAVSIAGTEGNMVMANRIKMKWLKNQKIDPQKAALYMLSYNDLFLYISSLDGGNDAGHDINDYLNVLNFIYWPNGITIDELKRKSAISVLDPFTYLSIWSEFHYIFSGRKTKIPMIKLFDFKFLPSFRLGLAPYGPEYYFENFIIRKNSPIYLYYRWGSFNNNKYWGMGVEYLNIFQNEKNEVGFRFDIFYQPRIYYKSGQYSINDVFVGYSEADLKKMVAGLHGSVFIEHKLKKNSKAYLELGYKTKGFLAGEALRNSFNVRFGLSTILF